MVHNLTSSDIGKLSYCDSGCTGVLYLTSNDSSEQPWSNIWPQVTVGRLHTPGLSIKRIFPEYWPREPGTHKNILQSPHGPVPELCQILQWRNVAGGTLHKSPVPIYHLGLGKTNFPRVPTSTWGKGGNYTHNSH